MSMTLIDLGGHFPPENTYNINTSGGHNIHFPKIIAAVAVIVIRQWGTDKVSTFFHLCICIT